MEQLVSVGAKVDSESVEQISEHIMKVVDSAAGDAVKIAAIQAIANALKVERINFSNCNFEDRV